MVVKKNLLVFTGIFLVITLLVLIPQINSIKNNLLTAPETKDLANKNNSSKTPTKNNESKTLSSERKKSDAEILNEALTDYQNAVQEFLNAHQELEEENEEKQKEIEEIKSRLEESEAKYDELKEQIMQLEQNSYMNSGETSNSLNKPLNYFLGASIILMGGLIIYRKRKLKKIKTAYLDKSYKKYVDMTK